MRVRIVRKLADRVDGIDLTHFDVGEVVDLPDPDGRLIIAEEWGVYARRQADLERDARGGGSGAIDRRRTSDDLYQRLKAKRDELDNDRRHLHRRASDDDPRSAPHAP